MLAPRRHQGGHDADYAPTGSNQITGQPYDTVADTYVRTGPGRIGSASTKCLYREYTDSGFSTRKNRAARDAYLGFMGPILRGEVGDTIKVVFRNTCVIPASVHPHGVFYAKSSEGAPYADNTSGKDGLDDAVPTNGRHTYTWLVPARAGPGPSDGSSVMWMYHSHTDEIAQTSWSPTSCTPSTATSSATSRCSRCTRANVCGGIS